MVNEKQSANIEESKIINNTVGIYPVTPLGISFCFFDNVDLLICRKDGEVFNLFSKMPILNIDNKDQVEQFNIEGRFSNGMLDALNRKILPSLILASPGYSFLSNFIEEITEIAVKLNDMELLKPYHPLNMFCFPIIILTSSGIIYEETINKLKQSLLYSNLPEVIINKVCSKVLRGSASQMPFREDSTYYPHKKGVLKIAVTKPELFESILCLLNKNKFNISIQKNPKRIEFEKAMVNIVTTSLAMVLALDKTDLKFKSINLQQILTSKDPQQATFINNLQVAVFNIGKKCNAFSESDQFETLWMPRKEQILKQDNKHMVGSLYSFKKMIKSNSFPEHLPEEDMAIINPLKRIAQENKLFEELALLENLEREIIETLNLAKTNADNISFCF